MPTLENITDNFIEDLISCATTKLKLHSVINAKAMHLLYELQGAKSRNDYDHCAFLIEEQIQLLGEKNLTINEEIVSRISRNTKITDQTLGQDPLFRKFSSAVIKAYRGLKLLKVTQFHAPGIAIIHRVWLGGNPSDERTTAAAAGNRAVMKKWYVNPTTLATDIQQVIWTNNKAFLLKSGDKTVHGITIRSIDELFSGDDSMYKYVKSFVHRGEFAFASDLLRFIILKHYGGLFLGMPWRPSPIQEKTPNIFCPSLYTVRALYMDTHEIHNELKLLNPFEGLKSGYFNMLDKIIKNPESFCNMVGIVDSDLLYAGCPNHPYICHALNIIEELISHGLKITDDQYFSAYRRRKYKTVLEKWLKQFSSPSTERLTTHSLSSEIKSANDIFSNELRGNLTINVTILTHVFALVQAFVDLGYMVLKPSTRSMRSILNKTFPTATEVVRTLSPTELELQRFMGYKLDPDNWFKLSWDGRFQGSMCPMLGIYRMNSGSWLQVSKKDKLSSEI